jgi:5'-3' exonuclease
MGIKLLNKFLYESDLITEYSSIKKYIDANKISDRPFVLAIDVSLFAYKFLYSKGNILEGFLHLMTKLLLNNIVPLPIFDGKPPLSKYKILNERATKKNKIKEKITLLNNKINSENDESISEQISKLNKKIMCISRENIVTIKKLFDLLHIKYLDACSEADYMCAKLYKEGIVDACLSDDLDILVHGCYNLIKIVNNTVIEINLNKILNKLDISYLQFVDMCILFGSDYINALPYIEPFLGYTLIKTYDNLTNIVETFLKKNNEKHSKFASNYKYIQNIYLTSSDQEIIPSNFRPIFSDDNIIDVANIIAFLKENNVESAYNLVYINKLNTINNNYIF